MIAKLDTTNTTNGATDHKALPIHKSGGSNYLLALTEAIERDSASDADLEIAWAQAAENNSADAVAINKYFTDGPGSVLGQDNAAVSAAEAKGKDGQNDAQTAIYQYQTDSSKLQAQSGAANSTTQSAAGVAQFMATDTQGKVQLQSAAMQFMSALNNAISHMNS